MNKCVNHLFWRRKYNMRKLRFMILLVYFIWLLLYQVNLTLLNLLKLFWI